MTPLNVKDAFDALENLHTAIDQFVVFERERTQLGKARAAGWSYVRSIKIAAFSYDFDLSWQYCPEELVAAISAALKGRVLSLEAELAALGVDMGKHTKECFGRHGADDLYWPPEENRSSLEVEGDPAP